MDAAARRLSPVSVNARRLLSTGSARRKVELAAALILTVLGTAAELVTIGAVVPLLAVAAQPSAIDRMPIVGGMLSSVGATLGVPPLYAAALFLVAAAAIGTGLRLLLSWVTSKFVFGLMQDVVLAVFGKAVHQPYAWYVQQNSSALLSALDKIWNLTFGVVSPLMLAASAAFTSSCLLVLIFVIDPQTAILASVCLGLLYGSFTLLTRAKLGRLSEQVARARTARIQVFQESLGGLRDILLDGSQRVFQANLARIEDRLRRDLITANFLQLAPRPIAEGAAVILIAVLAIWFSLREGGFLAAIPTLGAIAVGAQRLLPMIQAMYFGWTSYSVYAGSIQDVVDLLDAPTDQASLAPATQVPLDFTRTIELAGVGYCYAGTVDALAEVDLVVRRGEKIGIIGKTGSGKSTLVDVIMGLLSPTSGELLVDGRPVDGMTAASWRAQVAHVPQSIFLIDGSIADNIAFGRSATPDQQRIMDVATRAGLGEFLDRLPAGLDTSVGERGVRLSGGQRQRIGIARALFKGAAVLILDEATSSLDSETETAVMDSVSRFGSDLTIILIAHRLSTVAVCDRVYRLGNGKIVEHGSYAQVVLKSRADEPPP